MAVDTLRLIREKSCRICNHLTVQFSTEWTTLCMDTDAHHWEDAVGDAASALGRQPSAIDDSLYMDPGNFLQYVHVDDELLSGDDRPVRDMAPKLKQKILVKKVDFSPE